MRTLALMLVFFLPCAVAVAAPSNLLSRVSTVGRPVRVSLVNLSGRSRQVRLASGLIKLPVGSRLDLDSRVGATFQIVSDTDRSIDERMVIRSEDEGRLILVQ